MVIIICTGNLVVFSLFLSGFLNVILYASSCHICRLHVLLISSYLIGSTSLIFGEQWNFWSSLLFNFLCFPVMCHCINILQNKLSSHYPISGVICVCLCWIFSLPSGTTLATEPRGGPQDARWKWEEKLLFGGEKASEEPGLYSAPHQLRSSSGSYQLTQHITQWTDTELLSGMYVCN